MKNKYYIGIDPIREGSKSSIALCKEGKVIWTTNKRWKARFAMWWARVIGVKMLEETNESLNKYK